MHMRLTTPGYHGYNDERNALITAKHPYRNGGGTRF